MKTSRRTLLRAAGVCLSLPVLESFGAAPSKASPKRMIAINQDLGFIPKHFFPKKAGRDYAPSPYLEKIAAHREQFTVFSGLSHPGVDGGHRADKTFLTAAPHPGRASFRNSISLDQVMANEVGHETRFRSLSLGINDARSLSYTQAGVEIPTIQSAAELYKKMFLQGDRKAIEAQLVRLRKKGSILDVVMGQSSDLSKRVSASDRTRIDQFQTAVRTLEQRLAEAEAWETRLWCAKESVSKAIGTGLGGQLSDFRLVAVEPDESAVMSGDRPGRHGIQGLADGFIPALVNLDEIDQVARIPTQHAIHAAQQIAAEEGLLVGISSGANALAAAKVAEELGPGHNVVTVLCDRGERYLSARERRPH